MNLQHVFGIDMGTGSVKIYDRNSDSVIKESNMIAIRDRESVFAVGNEAYEISEKTPESIELITPMSAGRVQDVLMMEAVLHSLLRKYVRFAGYSPVLFFSVPLDMTELERRAYVSLAKKGRFRRSRIYFVEKPFADAFSMGISPVTAKGTMIVDLGAQSTEVSILSDGRVIISRTIDIGGESFDAAVVSGVKRKNGLTVSRRTAHRLKITLANLYRDPQEGCKVAGIDADSGLPRDGVISSYTVSSCVRDVLQEIASEIRRLLERIPPQIQSALLQEGIWLTGGCIRIPGIEKFLTQELQYPVQASELCEYGTVSGLKQVIQNPELRSYSFAPVKKKTL